MKEEPLPVRRIILDGVVHGVRKGKSWDEITWCDVDGDCPDAPYGARWIDGFNPPMVAAVWSTDAINCLECLNIGGPDG